MAAQSILDQVPLDFGPQPRIWDIRLKTALYRRDYAAANRVMATRPAKWANLAFGGDAVGSFADRQTALMHGDKQKALAMFAAAREKLKAEWADKPEDGAYLRDAASLDAELGRKEDAIREARRAVELVPIAKDSLNGPVFVTDLARVYTWTGERDRALEQLETVASIPGVGVTYGDLKLNPTWDPLRGNRRFEKIVNSLAPK